MPSRARARERMRETLRDQDRYVDSLVEGFRSELSAMVQAAQARTLGELTERLEIVAGRVLQTPGNMRVLRSLDSVLIKSLRRAGFDHLVEEFVSGFNGTLPFLDQMVDALQGVSESPLSVRLDKTDVSILESQQITAADGLSSLVESAALAAKRKAMFSIGAAPFADVVEQIASTMSASVATASNIAETSMVMFTRTVTDRGFRKIEDGLQRGAVRYRYDGPNDKLTRPFCKRMLARSAPLTREEIERLDNGQLPNPMVTGGGYRCRHQWVIDEIRG